MIGHFIVVQTIATVIGGTVFAYTGYNTALAGWIAGSVYWLFAAKGYI